MCMPVVNCPGALVTSIAPAPVPLGSVFFVGLPMRLVVCRPGVVNVLTPSVPPTLLSVGAAVVIVALTTVVNLPGATVVPDGVISTLSPRRVEVPDAWVVRTPPPFVASPPMPVTIIGDTVVACPEALVATVKPVPVKSLVVLLFPRSVVTAPGAPDEEVAPTLPPPSPVVPSTPPARVVAAVTPTLPPPSLVVPSTPPARVVAVGASDACTVATPSLVALPPLASVVTALPPEPVVIEPSSGIVPVLFVVTALGETVNETPPMFVVTCPGTPEITPMLPLSVVRAFGADVVLPPRTLDTVSPDTVVALIVIDTVAPDPPIS